MDQDPDGQRAGLGRPRSGPSTARADGPPGPAEGLPGATPDGTALSVPSGDGPPATPALLPALVGSLAAVAATGALWWAAGQDHSRYTAVVLAVQVVLVAAWCLASRPPAWAAVAGVGVLAAVGADGAALWYPRPSADPLVAVVVGAFLAAIVLQLARGVARRDVTDAFGATMALVVAVVGLATTVSLHRGGGAALLTAFVLATGAGIGVARLADLALLRPAVHEAVPRGAVGILLGGLAGGAVAGLSAALSEPLSIWLAAIAGWFVATTAVLADLAVDYAGVARTLDGGRRPATLPQSLLGPLFGLAVAAPAGYVFGLVVLS